MTSGWWMADLFDQPVVLVSWIVWVIVSITLHELGHGIAAIRQGDRTPIETGHMTLNPVVHMGVPSLVLFAIIGLAWGAMPVNPSRFRSRHGDAIVSFAGPLVNLALAAGTMVIAGVLTAFPGALGDPLHDNLTTFFVYGAMLNVVLFVLNLLPIPPLDGSRILASFVPAYRARIQSQGGFILAIIAIAVLFSFGADAIFGAGVKVTAEGVRLVREAVLSVLGRGGA